MKGVLQLVGKRLVLLPVSLLVLLTLSFLVVDLLPGNPAVEIAGGYASEAEVQQIEDELGLNLPFGERYVTYLWATLRGDFGTSLFSGRSVADELWSRLPATIGLVAAGILVAATIGLIVGISSSYFTRRWVSRVASTWITVFQATPDFFLGLLLIFFGYYVLGVTPPPVGHGSTPGEFVGYLVLPALALGLVYSAFLAKITRASFGSAIKSPQVEFARASGLPEWRVVGYALSLSRASILTYAAMLFGSLLGGNALVEKVFSWRGVGQWAIDSVLSLDLPAIRAYIVVIGFFTIMVFLLLDVIVQATDRRVML